MFNLLKMDCRRLVKSRSFYLILAITLGVLLFMNLMLAIMTTPEVLDAMEASGAEVNVDDRQLGESIRTMNQLAFVHELIGSGLLLIMTGLGTTLFVSGDFTSGYIKNICFAQPRRGAYVLSKILLAGIYSGILTLISVLFSLALPPLFGLHPEASGPVEILPYIFWVWLPHWAFSLMALALVLATRGVSLGITMSLVSGSGLPATLLGTLARQLGWAPVDSYFLSNVTSDLCAPQANGQNLALILACTLGWGLIYGCAGLLLMKKRDI